MPLLYQEVTLDGNSPDTEARLVFRDGRLLAVLTCLGPIHGDLAGHWFIEATFGPVPQRQPATHPTLAGFEEWLGTGVNR